MFSVKRFDKNAISIDWNADFNLDAVIFELTDIQISESIPLCGKVWPIRFKVDITFVQNNSLRSLDLLNIWAAYKRVEIFYNKYFQNVNLRIFQRSLSHKFRCEIWIDKKFFKHRDFFWSILFVAQKPRHYQFLYSNIANSLANKIRMIWTL